FNENPSLLALILYAFNICAAGFDARLKFPSANKRPKRPTKEPTPQHYQDVINSVVSLPISTVKYRILETLYAYRSLVGRGTMHMVYKVAPNNDPDKPLAYKVGWPVVVRKLEADTIKRLRKRLPKTAKELELPRMELLKVDTIKDFEDRVLHALMMKVYGKLWEVGNVDAFMDVWVHCLE
ncbi:hypothetical protein DXG03_005214, partial [Asterophora parasitica]